MNSLRSPPGALWYRHLDVFWQARAIEPCLLMRRVKTPLGVRYNQRHKRLHAVQENCKGGAGPRLFC